jgi:glutamine synthetase
VIAAGELAAAAAPADRVQALRAAGVRTVQFGFPDVDGIFRGKRVPADYFCETVALKGSNIADVIFAWDVEDELIDGLEFSGWQTGYPDVVLMPDLDTLRVIPWEPTAASAVCDVNHPGGEPVEIAPRALLKRQIERAAQLGVTFSVGYELEFYLFRETAASVREKGFSNLEPATPDICTYGLHRLAMLDDVVGEIRDGMIAYGVPVEAANTEYGPGQLEINIHHSEPLEAADRVLLYKTGVRDIAARHGYVASFMAKISDAGAGSSGHVHQSVAIAGEPERNAFWDEASEGGSAMLSHAVAGQLASMHELCLMFCPNVNSYKRRVPGSWAPTTPTHGFDNRTAALRVMAREPGPCRIEHRLPGADANPYLAIAACIAGAIDGIERELEPPPAVVGNAYEADVRPLPGSLAEAIPAFEGSALARRAFGDRFVDHFAQTRRWERDRHRAAVSEWERRRYLERV